MGLHKINYISNETIITANNLNDIQDNIILNSKNLKNITPRNLLDNSDFTNPVNQRGYDSYVNVAGTIDRWVMGGAGTVTLSGRGLTLEPGQDYFDFKQFVSNNQKLIKRAMTAAVKLVNEAPFIMNFTFGTNAIAGSNNDAINIIHWEGNAIYIRAQRSVEVEWAALYEGEYTEDTLPEYQPKGYENELLVCRQYDLVTGEYIGLRKFSQPRNLLDNSDFSNPVNQRGYTRWTAEQAPTDGTADPNTKYNFTGWAGYTFDRWAAYADGIIDMRVETNGIRLHGRIVHMIAAEDYAKYNGKTMTLAVQIDGNKYLCVGSVTQKGQWNPVHAHGQTPCGDIWFESEDDNKIFVIISNHNASGLVEWAVLYEGEYTLDTLPEYQSKGYAAEFAECCRYYHHIGGTTWLSGSLINGVGFDVPIVVPSHMRQDVKVSLVTANQVEVFNNNGVFVSTTFNGIAYSGGGTYHARFEMPTDTTVGHNYLVRGIIALSADL